MLRLCLISLLFMSPLSAVLPPAWQGVAEVNAILNAPELSHYLGSGDLLESIVKTEKGWLITTNHSQIQVLVKYKRQPMPGPAKFELHFSNI